MGFRKTSKVRSEGEKMPAFLDAECLGEKCPNWKGEPCESEFEWMNAKATVTEDRDTSQPPFINETQYVIYGQHCGALSDRPLVSQRVEIIDGTEVSGMALMAITGMYGDMPVQINRAGGSASITTIASSDPIQ
jgi:hypothetical protein